jgi:hypothetical protein
MKTNFVFLNILFKFKNNLYNSILTAGGGAAAVHFLPQLHSV